MKTFLYASIAIILGFAFSVGSFSAIYGSEFTFSSLQTSYYRLLSSGHEYSPKTDYMNLGNSVLGTSDIGYNSLEIEAVGSYSVAKRKAPLFVPTNGIAGHKDFLFIPAHPGIDIWTNANGRGLDGVTSRGYPVYSACTGRVIRIFEPNQEIEVMCEHLSGEYADLVPTLKIKVLYSHMGDGKTKAKYHTLRMGQYLTQGELIGYQGNISSFAPQNTITHLHFGVYDVSRGGKGIAIDPAPYIGLPTNQVGQLYSAGI